MSFNVQNTLTDTVGGKHNTVGPTCVQGLLYHIVTGTQGPLLQAFMSAGFSAMHSPPPPPSFTPPRVRQTTSLLCTPGPHCAEHWGHRRGDYVEGYSWVHACFSFFPPLLFICGLLTVLDHSVKYQLVTQGPMLHSSLPSGRRRALHSLSFTTLPWSLTQRTARVLLPTPQSTEHCRNGQQEKKSDWVWVA